MTDPLDVTAGRAPWAVCATDALAGLRLLPDDCVQTCCTSPPYYALRDYGTARWEGGDPACSHAPTRQPRTERQRSGLTGSLSYVAAQEPTCRDLCGKCGARRIDQQLGLESRPDCFGAFTGSRCGECYVCRMTAVFDEVRRVLRDDGTLWLNCAGSYAGSWGNYGGHNRGKGKQRTIAVGSLPSPGYDGREDDRPATSSLTGWKNKDYINVPALLSESLRASGWWLRSEIALVKLSPMPESAKDRPSRATEKLYLFAKSAKYFYDGESERVAHLTNLPVVDKTNRSRGRPVMYGIDNGPDEYGSLGYSAGGRNLWDYWTDATEDLPENVWPWNPEGGGKGKKHHATFPTWLPRRCLRLGASLEGCCGRCGAPRRRVVERKANGSVKVCPSDAVSWQARREGQQRGLSDDPVNTGGLHGQYLDVRRETLGWAASCPCEPSAPLGCLILDPFCGLGTTGVVARQLGMRFVGFDLSEKYVALARQRIASASPLADAADAAPAATQPDLFGEQP